MLSSVGYHFVAYVYHIVVCMLLLIGASAKFTCLSS